MLKTALIFAAGRGERLCPLTKETPKPMLRLGQHPILEYHLIKLKNEGFTDVIINHAYLGYQIKAYFGDGKSFGLNIEYFSEPPGGLETGGTLAALNYFGKLHEEFLLTINADIVTCFPLHGSISLSKDVNAHLILIPKSEQYPTPNFGISHKEKITNMNKKYIFSGIAFYRVKALEELPIGRYSIRDWLFQQAQEEKLSGEVFYGSWDDIGSIERFKCIQNNWK